MNSMAEVRKKVVEDKYNTNSIKKTKTTKKNVSTKKVEEKKEEINKKGLFAKIGIFINGVKSEFHKIHWTSKSNMVKYSIATIFFILFCSAYFYLVDVLFALVRSIIK